MCMLRKLASIAVRNHQTGITTLRGQTLDIISHRQYQLIRHQTLAHQIQSKRVHHFLDHQTSFFHLIGRVQHLS